VWLEPPQSLCSLRGLKLHTTPAGVVALHFNQLVTGKNKICGNCPFISQCTESKNNQKLIQRHIWEFYVEEAEHLRHTYEIKQIYAKRKETIERVFADAKEKHGMRWTTLRGLKKLLCRRCLLLLP
jgi:hypothetical protein